jgi:hypothetical protein
VRDGRAEEGDVPLGDQVRTADDDQPADERHQAAGQPLLGGTSALP